MVEKTKTWLRKTSLVGIYRITSPSGRMYIGQSWSIKDRWRLHKCLDKAGCPLLINSFKKYGADAHKFEIIHALPQDVSQNVMDEYEILYINQYKDCGIPLLNIHKGGNNKRNSPQTIEKQRSRMRGNTWGFKKGQKVWNSGTVGVCKAWNKGIKTGVKLSPEGRLKLSKINTGNKYNVGRKMPEKTREALKKANVGRKMPDHLKEILSKFRTPENAIRMGHMNRGKIRSEENKRQISNTLKNRTDNKGELSPRAKITNAIVLEIRARYKLKEYTTTDISKDYSMSRTNAKDIIARRIWKHI